MSEVAVGLTEAVSGQLLSRYLRVLGWDEHTVRPGEMSVWRWTDPDEQEFEILVPLDSSYRDYRLQLSYAIELLHEALRTPKPQLIASLINWTSDVVRVRAGYDSPDGSVPFSIGRELVQGTRTMLVAAACATIRPRPYYGPRKPGRVMEYMEHVRLGQTEQGSFVLTVLSAAQGDEIEPSKEQLEIVQSSAQPFERRVAITLSQSLDATQKAAESFAESSSFEPFTQAIPKGLSANLCDAVIQLIGDKLRQVDVSFEWSKVLPVPVATPDHVSFTTDQLPAIRYASERLREEAPRDTTVVGFVIGLDREEGDPEGVATIDTRIEGKRAKVRITLYGEEYDLAIRAHRQDEAVSAAGFLDREGRRWWLRDVQSFQIGLGHNERSQQPTLEDQET